ncbi:MAG TPA: methyltransferase domain-containing protein [Acidimicrobiales bacterium]|nr:methyltransferase domain-containing protein [Acidimicrobiales bacterium]
MDEGQIQGHGNIANEEMAAAWDGHEGDVWTEHAERYEAAGQRLWNVFLERRPIAAGDSVLDIGCGTGKSTREAARLATPGQVLGVDLSSRMLEYARRRSEEQGLTNVRFEQADAQVHSFEEAGFDVAISSFGAMFFADPFTAFANIGRALKPGGRLAVLAWQELAKNRWLNVVREALAAGRTLPQPPPSAPGPFGLADPTHVRRVLEAAGFEEIDLQAVEEPMNFGTDGDDAFSFFATAGIVEGLTEDLEEEAKAAALEKLHRALVAHQSEEGVLLGSSAWLITAHRP